MLNSTIVDLQKLQTAIIRHGLQFFLGIAIGFFFSCVAIVANVIVLVLLLRKKQQRTPFDLVIASLSITDLLASACCSFYILYRIAIIFFISTELENDYRQSAMALDVATILILQSLLHILLITFLRFCALFWPLKFRQFATKLLLKLLIGVAWIMSIIVGVVMVRIKDTFFMLGLVILASGVIVCCAYAMVAVKICMLLIKKRFVWNKEQRVLLNSFGVTISFFLCFLPFAFRESGGELSRHIQRPLASSFMPINFVADPLLYFYFSYWLSKRDEIRRIRN